MPLARHHDVMRILWRVRPDRRPRRCPHGCRISRGRTTGPAVVGRSRTREGRRPRPGCAPATSCRPSRPRTLRPGRGCLLSPPRAWSGWCARGPVGNHVQDGVSWSEADRRRWNTVIQPNAHRRSSMATPTCGPYGPLGSHVHGESTLRVPGDALETIRVWLLEGLSRRLVRVVGWAFCGVVATI